MLVLNCRYGDDRDKIHVGNPETILSVEGCDKRRVVIYVTHPDGTEDVLTLPLDATFMIGQVKVLVIFISNYLAKLGFIGDRSIPVNRRKVLERIREEEREWKEAV